MRLSKAKYDIGTSAKTDYLQARVDYGARQSDSLAQHAAMVRAFADLAALLAESPYKQYIVDDSLTVDLSLQPAQPELLDRSPLIDIARRSTEIAALRYRLARTLRLPQLDVNAGYGYSRSRNGAGLLLFNQTIGPTVGAGINIPLYQGGAIRREIAIAGLEQTRTQLLYERQRTESARQYAAAWADYDAARASILLERQNIGYAKENLDIQKARFRLGVAATLEAREAEAGYVQALIRLYTAAYNAKIAEARVLEVEGRLVE
jgi:outer membrane protein TolC